MAKPDFSKKISKLGFLGEQSKIFEKKIIEKTGFAILITLKNQLEKWSRLFFYLLGTQKFP